MDGRTEISRSLGLAALAFAALAVFPGLAATHAVEPTSSPASDASDAAEGAPGRVWLIVEEGPAADAIEAGAVRGAADQGLTLVARTLRPDRAAQAESLREAVAEGPEGLAIAVSRPDALTEVISDARSAGIPIILVSHGLSDWGSLGTQGFVGQDDLHAGQEAARALLDAGVERAFCVQDHVHDAMLEARCEGAISTMAAAGATMDVLYALDPPGDPSGVRAAIAGRVVRDPEIDGVLATESDGLVAALDGRDRWPEARDVTIGAIAEGPLESEVEQALEDGELAFVVDQQPELQGERAMASLRAIIDGDDPSATHVEVIEPRIVAPVDG